jgi:hypothetical protein
VLFGTDRNRQFVALVAAMSGEDRLLFARLLSGLAFELLSDSLCEALGEGLEADATDCTFTEEEVQEMVTSAAARVRLQSMMDARRVDPDFAAGRLSRLTDRVLRDQSARGLVDNWLNHEADQPAGECRGLIYCTVEKGLPEDAASNAQAAVGFLAAFTDEFARLVFEELHTLAAGVCGVPGALWTVLGEEDPRFAENLCTGIAKLAAKPAGPRKDDKLRLLAADFAIVAERAGRDYQLGRCVDVLRAAAAALNKRG